MKTSEIKPELAVNVLRNAVAVTNFEELKNVGLPSGGYSFRAGQTLYIPDTWEGLDMQSTSFHDNKLYHILMGVDNLVMRIPVSAFRKKVQNWEEVYKEYPLNAQLMGFANEYERVAFLIGKTIQVTKLIEAKTPFYRGGELQVDDEGRVKLVTREFPIFQLVK